MGGGAWPFLVRGLVCLVDSDNERDRDLGLMTLIYHTQKNSGFLGVGSQDTLSRARLMFFDSGSETPNYHLGCPYLLVLTDYGKQSRLGSHGCRRSYRG